MDRFCLMFSLRFRQAAMVVVLATAWTGAYAENVRLVYYDVAGNSAAKLRQEIDVKGPLDDGKRFDANTTWHVAWTFRYVPSGSGCRLTKVATTLDGTMKLPRWQHGRDASPSLVKKWERYLAALRVHEDGHYAHGVSAENEIDALGRSFHVTGSCTTVTKAFNDQANAIVARYAAMDVTYDSDTDHGKSQGATFP